MYRYPIIYLTNCLFLITYCFRYLFVLTNHFTPQCLKRIMIYSVSWFCGLTGCPAGLCWVHSHSCWHPTAADILQLEWGSRAPDILTHMSASQCGLLARAPQCSTCLSVRGLQDSTLRLDDSLERLTGLRKAIIFMVRVYHSEKILIKISKWKRPMGQIPGETTSHKLLGISSQWNLMETCLILPAAMCENTWKVLPNRKAYLNLSVQGFCWGLVV